MKEKQERASKGLRHVLSLKLELSCAVINASFFLLDKFYTHLVYIRFFIMNKTHTQKKF